MNVHLHVFLFHLISAANEPQEREITHVEQPDWL